MYTELHSNSQWPCEFGGSSMTKQFQAGTENGEATLSSLINLPHLQLLSKNLYFHIEYYLHRHTFLLYVVGCSTSRNKIVVGLHQEC